mmetsp:Transcript_2967/g.9149  ORF Transcript_2967/g.9149 Transcript_2967/m.9149 type:complete len:221 (+) Transcript_2967:324-986(+)
MAMANMAAKIFADKFCVSFSAAVLRNLSDFETNKVLKSSSFLFFSSKSLFDVTLEKTAIEGASFRKTTMSSSDTADFESRYTSKAISATKARFTFVDIDASLSKRSAIISLNFSRLTFSICASKFAKAVNFFSFSSYEIEASTLSSSIKSASKFTSVKPLIIVLAAFCGYSLALTDAAVAADVADDEFKNVIAASRILRYASENFAQSNAAFPTFSFNKL